MTADRDAAPGTRFGTPQTRFDPAPVEFPKVPRTYHVWVNLSGMMSDKHVVEYPGLVIAWRRSVTGWEAQVMWVTPRQDRASDTAHLGWLPAHQLRQA